METLLPPGQCIFLLEFAACFGLFGVISPDSDGSESGWWTISIWQLVSRVHCPNLVLFYFILGVFAPQKLDRP